MLNIKSLNEESDTVHWEKEVFNSQNINEIYGNFFDKMEKCIKKYIPTKTITVRPRDKVFMNNFIRKLMRKRNRMHRKAVRTQNPVHWEQYRFLRNKVIDEIRISRAKHNKKLSDQLDISIPHRKWWIIVKSLTKQNNNCMSLPSLKSVDHNLFSSY